jgi:glycosyltransferase involved in cell wall biosynthesis
VRTVHNCVEFRGYEIPEASLGPTLRFIFVGRFSADKGVDVLIRAFAEAARTDSHIQLSLVGPIAAQDGGEERLVEECRAFIRAEKMEERIEIVPPIFDRKRLEDRIRASDIVCLPSVRGETLNMSIIESMRLAKCLLISDLPANAPLVRTGFNGLFAKVGNQADWAQKILYLAVNRDSVVEMGRNAFRYGLEKFSATRIARDYVADFNELLHRARR